MNYISLFSSAGVGCYGFKEEGFKCVATNELLEKRLNIQKFNNKCEKDSGYILGDLSEDNTKNKLFLEVNNNQKVDVIIATPPCQGMSIANHKKKDEKGRNSLVVESIKIVKKINPKLFIFENVRTFMKTICTDIDNLDKPISKAIELNLGGNYNFLSKTVNFKEYGSNSSRTRTLVIGVRKDIKDISPYDIFPKRERVKSLKEVIGDFPKLENMGEISRNDIYHSYRKFDTKMLAWIENIKEGESAFDNKESFRIPHQIKDGKVVFNKNKNGDKYSRCYWEKSGACVHTRNDILASQNTIHPEDNRVFSIRELMQMMNIPKSFSWSEKSFEDLNKLPENEKVKFLKSEELTIRKSIGEAVPTNIFQQIAKNIKEVQKEKKLSDIFYKLESSNSEKERTSAYYTRQDIVFNTLQDLPDFKNKKVLHILEPSVGVGNFIPQLIKKYADIPKVVIDVIDIDQNSLEHLKSILELIQTPQNFSFNFINYNFILWQNSRNYDLVIGNPPYQKISQQQKSDYTSIFSPTTFQNQKTSNLYSFFIEKALQIGKFISLVVPKSLINSPEFDITRDIIEDKILKITDYGEKAFKGVKIETINILISNEANYISDEVKIESYITNQVYYQKRDYIFSKDFPYWLIYRDIDFDNTVLKMDLGIFTSYRDRQITKKITKPKGEIRVLKSRNIANNSIQDIKDYDTYVDSLKNLSISKYFNIANLVLVPNLTYNPRATFLPKNSIVDGSVAILSLKENDKIEITEKHLDYYSSDEFREYYRVARNFGTRSLNIDNNSVFFFGRLKDRIRMKTQIQDYFKTLDLDIRKTGNARFMDQKVTPDILTIISDCVVEFLEQNKNIKFTSKDIWSFDYSNENIKDIFNKPDVFDEKAQNEYDKVFQQPLKALAYAGILKEEKQGRQIYFSVQHSNLLEFISIKERNSLLFLQIYLEKVLKDSDIWNIFENFFNLQTKDSFNSLKLGYEDFIITNTSINGETEVRRIFTKVINPLAFKYKKLGTRRGNISKTPISLDELFYNRVNWRDINKSKSETRKEFEENSKSDKFIAYQKYSLEKAKKLIKKYHSPDSEVQDEFSNGEATQVHHIFMKSEFPTIDSYLENLILLTATQHYTKAHPNNNTKIIDKDYQKICLLAKSKSVSKFPDIYSVEDFKFVLETGLSKSFLNSKNIESQIISYYQ